MGNLFYLSLIILGASVASLVYTVFIAKEITRERRDLADLKKTVTLYAAVQRENTKKLIEILQKPFTPNDLRTIKEPNEIVEKEDTIEFSELNPLDLPKDVKFEMEGGDTGIPAGYQ